MFIVGMERYHTVCSMCFIFYPFSAAMHCNMGCSIICLRLSFADRTTKSLKISHVHITYYCLIVFYLRVKGKRTGGSGSRILVRNKLELLCTRYTDESSSVLRSIMKHTQRCCVCRWGIELYEGGGRR